MNENIRVIISVGYPAGPFPKQVKEKNKLSEDKDKNVPLTCPVT